MSGFTVISSAPVILESDSSSITVAWRGVDTGIDNGITTMHELQMQECAQSQQRSEDAWSLWKSLSTSLIKCSARKKNLINDTVYRFRVRSKSTSSSGITQSDFSPASVVMQCLDADIQLLPPVELLKADAESVSLKWTTPQGVAAADIQGYRLRFRSEQDTEWTDVGGGKVLSGCEVRKKGLVKGISYYFSVRPETLTKWNWSPQAGPFTVVSYHENMTRIMPPQLLTKSGLQSTQDLLENKIVLLYFSAHWCGPCRSFTPRLADIYKEAKADASLASKFEIVFVSCDHDEDEFKGYYGEHHGLPFLMIGREEKHLWEHLESKVFHN
jgi:thiol-disulfide isomerase/thioredoxin